MRTAESVLKELEGMAEAVERNPDVIEADSHAEAAAIAIRWCKVRMAKAMKDGIYALSERGSTAVSLDAPS